MVTQRLVSHHYLVTDGRLDSNAIPFRYVWPAWDRRPFDRSSAKHVSVWEKPAPTSGI